MVVKITGRPFRRSIFESPAQLLAEKIGRYFNNMDPAYCLFSEELNRSHRIRKMLNSVRFGSR